MRDASDELLVLFDRADIKNPNSAQITDRFTCFSVKWESDLKPEIADYDTLSAEAKKLFGLTDTGKPLVARYIAVKQTAQNPPVIPATVKSIIEKALAAVHPGTCLKKPGAAIEAKPVAPVGAV